jgi:uncharacterized membrane protein (UPF0127 family)
VSFLAPLLEAPGRAHVLRSGRTGRTLATSIECAFDSERRRRGLLGRQGLEPDAVLVLAPCGGVHTFFMQFPIDVVFVRRDGTILKTCVRLKPWRAAFAWGAFAAIEFSAGAAVGLKRGDSLVVEPSRPNSADADEAT